VTTFRSRLALALALALAACCLMGSHRRVADLPTVPQVDLARYAGTWHEIARLPNLFQASCVRSQARYEPRSDGSLTVVNSCVTGRGRCREVVGRAEPVPCSGNARLRVRFGGLAALVPVPREGNYWIIALDDDYQWAMVGTPDRRFLWILARDTCLPADVYAGLVSQARCLGFEVDRLVTR
jgi:apolipoprotein D and lipocalin family protein